MGFGVISISNLLDNDNKQKIKLVSNPLKNVVVYKTQEKQKLNILHNTDTNTYGNITLYLLFKIFVDYGIPVALQTIDEIKKYKVFTIK